MMTVFLFIGLWHLHFENKKGIFLFECQKSLHLPLTRLIWFDNLTLL
ncbi:hypothetical protein LCAUW1_1650 [Lacticaseibacillus paracasei]|nr:hypothetical protein LCAUW1_1650 [Lacticaseibacillus paracasei]